MILSKTAESPRALAEVLRGREVASASDGGGSSADATFGSVAGAFETSSVAEGDVLYVSGVGTFSVASVTGETSLEIDGTFSETFSGKAYKICRNRIDPADILYVGPDGSQNMKWVVIYDSATFSNA